ncbi:MAG: hypothetical protein ACODAG_02185 [Myxococcota bacterium]
MKGMLAWAAWGLLLVLASVQARASTPAEGPLARCLQRATDVLREDGARPRGRPRRIFMTEGDRRTIDLRTTREGCLGVLAVGHDGVAKLDVALHTATGLRLDHRADGAPHGYVRFCGVQGLRLALSIGVGEGQGEVWWRVFEQAPLQLPDLNRRVGLCFGGQAGGSHAVADVGPDPEGGDVEAAFETASAALADRGYGAPPESHSGRLATGAMTHVPMTLPAGGCHAVLAVGDASVEQLELRIYDTRARLVARDVQHRRRGLVRLCSEDGGPHVAQLRMHAGDGEFMLGHFELTEVPDRWPPGVKGSIRARYAEMAAVMRAGGARPPAVRAWAHLLPERGAGVPVSLTAGRCYVLGAVRAGELDGADIDLVLVGPEGRLVARDVGPGPEPRVWHCPARSAPFRLRAEVHGGAGRVLFMIAEAPTEGGR